jgi:hypothetical protein
MGVSAEFENSGNAKTQSDEIAPFRGGLGTAAAAGFF